MNQVFQEEIASRRSERGRLPAQSDWPENPNYWCFQCRVQKPCAVVGLSSGQVVAAHLEAQVPVCQECWQKQWGRAVAPIAACVPVSGETQEKAA